MTRANLNLIAESIRAALVEIEQCPDISQGVEDDLRMSLELLEAEVEEQEEEPEGCKIGREAV